MNVLEHLLRLELRNGIKCLLAFFGLKHRKGRLYFHQRVLPRIEANIAGFKLSMDVEHSLPELMEEYPLYSTNIPSLAKAVKGKYPDACLIDIGANIGDSIALTRSVVELPVLAIEGSPYYFSFLTENVIQFPGVICVNLFLDEEVKLIDARAVKDGGSLQLHPENNANVKVQVSTLDSLLDTNPAFKNAKFLKIDTDGFDFKVLRGARNLLRGSTPVLFIEYDASYLMNNGENAIVELFKLSAFGYDEALYYDNFGRLLISLPLNQELQHRQLLGYIDGRHGTFPYFDLVIFAKKDHDLATRFIASEMLRLAEFDRDSRSRQKS